MIDRTYCWINSENIFSRNSSLARIVRSIISNIYKFISDRIRSKKKKKTSNPNTLSPPGGYVAACVARYGSFSFLRGVVAPIAAINRYSCACARVHAWLCGEERLRIPACTLRSTPRGRSFSARSLSAASSAFVRPWTHFRNEICEIIAGPSGPSPPSARNPWNPTGELPSGISATDSSETEINV